MRLQSLLYAALNPVMRSLLRSPLHGVVSRNLGILRYRGRKSGRSFETPLSYVRDGDRVRFMSSHNTRWWTNFVDGPTPVEVEVGREILSGTARLLDARASELHIAPLQEGVREFLTALPRDAVVYGIGLDSDRRPVEADIASRTDHVVLIEVQLAANAG
jgi:hypothetical protein